MLTRDQERAKLIFERTQGAALSLSESERKTYGAMAHQLPILVRTAGLCQALEFVASRNKPPLDLLLDHLAAATGMGDRATLLRHSQTDHLEAYMRLTREVMAALVWQKRFAQSVLRVEPDEAGDER